MPPDDAAKTEEIAVFTISPTDLPTTIVVNSKPYILDKPSCRLCRALPTNSLIELTLDLLFGTRTYKEIIETYSSFILEDKGTPISEYVLANHRKHSKLEYMKEEDRKLLEINYKQIKVKEKVLEKLNGEFRLDTAQVDAIKKAIQSFTTFEGIFASQQAELAELEAGKLPDNMKDTHQTTDKDGTVITDPLRPLVEKSRRQVMATQKEITALALHLAEVIQTTTKGSSNQRVALLVADMWESMKKVGQGLAEYEPFGADLIRDLYPEDETLHARWLAMTEQYFQTEILDHMKKIQGLLANMLIDK